MDAIEKVATDSEGDEAGLLDNSGDEQPPNTSHDGTLEAIRGMETKMVDTLRNFAETLTTSIGRLAPKRRSRSSSEDADSSDTDRTPAQRQGEPSKKKRRDDPTVEIDKEVSELLSMSNKKQSAKDVAGSPTASTSAGDAILAGIANDFDLVDQCGEDIPEQLASLVDKLLQTKMSEEKLKEKQNNYLRPKNCEKMIPTRVNAAIWARLQSDTRSRDIKMQRVQCLLLKAVVAQTRVTASLLKLKETTSGATSPQSDTAIVQAIDAIAFAVQANHKLNQRRQELIRPDLNEQYRQLCAEHVPCTTELFGDDLPKTLQDISTTNRVAQKLAGRGQRHYSSQSYSYKGQSTRDYPFPNAKNERRKLCPQNFQRKRRGGKRQQTQ